MSGAIYTAAAGALNYQMRLEILSNNLANINTAGFKEDRISFKGFDLSEAPQNKPNGSVSSNKNQGLFPIPSGTRPNFSQGRMRYTGNRLDLALQGDGFFCVETPEGTRYTRNGVFTLGSDGLLVTQEGYPVLGSGGEIRISDIEDIDLAVDEQGNISVNEKQISSLKIVDFKKPYLLKKVGDTLFAPDGQDVSEKDPEAAKVKQGFVELSNVDAIKAMTNMIDALRGYESYQKIIRSIDDVTGKAINEVGRIG